MGHNTAVLFVGTMSFMAVSCWIGYQISLYSYTQRKRAFERSNPGETYPHRFDSASGIGFGSLGGILVLLILGVFS